MSYDEECYCASNDGAQCVFCELATDARMERLAKSLAIGAALCEAFNRGLYNIDCCNVFPSVNWWPGCKWSIP